MTTFVLINEDPLALLLPLIESPDRYRTYKGPSDWLHNNPSQGAVAPYSSSE